VLSFVDDLEDRVASLAREGIKPALRETHDGGVTKVTYRDPDGNEISLGGGPRRIVPSCHLASSASLASFSR
jgi:hypothetical protein